MNSIEGHRLHFPAPPSASYLGQKGRSLSTTAKAGSQDGATEQGGIQAAVGGREQVEFPVASPRGLQGRQCVLLMKPPPPDSLSLAHACSVTRALVRRSEGRSFRYTHQPCPFHLLLLKHCLCMCMNVLPACMYMQHRCTWYPGMTEEGIGSPGAGVINGHESP